MFITLEGIEGAGKTTQIKHIVKFLQSAGHNCVATREPGGTSIGKRIRAILLDPESKDIYPFAELLLYMADRVQHINEFIEPHLSAGKTVLCDRYYDATVVYQGFARGFDIELINRLHILTTKDLKPDITILLDLSPEIGLARAKKQIKDGTRAGSETRFEKETLLFHKKIRLGYLELARAEPERFCVIDASRDENWVCREIVMRLRQFEAFSKS